MLGDVLPMLLQSWTMVGPQFENCDGASAKVLLVTHVLIADDEKIETGFLRRNEQITVFEFAPPHLHGCLHVMSWKSQAHLFGRANVQQHFHRLISEAIRSHPYRKTALACSRVTPSKVSRK